MPATEGQIKDLDGRVKSLESKFNFAVTLALFLGVSVAGLGTWVKTEAGRVSDLHDQVNTLEPFVKDAKTQLAQIGQEQIVLIQQKAAPIVSDLTKQVLDKMATNSKATNEGTTATNKYGLKDFGTTEMRCPTGQYLAGITVHWGGTCNGECDQDGGPIHALVPICQKLVP